MELRMRHLPPSRELQLSIDRGVRGINERTLVNGYDLKLTTADVVPSVGFASRGSLFPADVLQGLPVFALNVDSIDVNFTASNRILWRLSSPAGSTATISSTGILMTC